MRKLLIGILIILLLILAGYMLVDKISIGSLQILGIQEIIKKNEELDNKITNATKLATVTYQSELKTLENANKSLQEQKQTYDNYILSDDGTGVVSQIQSYEVEYLWTKIGNYAKREGVVLKMDVEVNNATLGTYNLNFTVTGSYVGITEFIYDLDNDSSLLFKIESFKLTPQDSENNLIATFTCKDISINIDSSLVNEAIQDTSNETITQNNNSQDGKNNTNTTNTTSNNTTNTNSINTTNTSTNTSTNTNTNTKN